MLFNPDINQKIDEFLFVKMYIDIDSLKLWFMHKNADKRIRMWQGWQVDRAGSFKRKLNIGDSVE